MSLADFAALNERRAEPGLSTFMNPRNSAAGHDPPARPEADAPSGRCRCGPTASAPTDGLAFDAPLGGARVAARARLPRQPRHRAARHARTRSSRSAATGRSAAARWTSRSTASSSRSTTSSCSAASASSAATRAGRSPGSSRRRRRSRRCIDIDVERRQVRRPAPVRGARAGPRRRRDGQARDAAQRGGPRAQGHPRRRRGDRAARRRRDPAGRLARAARRRARGPRAGRRSRRRSCPVCDTPTVKPEGSSSRSCPNRDCPGRRWQLLKHFVSRGAMDIDGLGEKQVALLHGARAGHDGRPTSTG